MRSRTEPLPDPAKFARREGEAEKHAERRRNADQEAEYTAVTCVAVYMLLMSFSQRGIDRLRNYQEHLRMRYPDGDFVVSVGFDDGEWFLLAPDASDAHASVQHLRGSKNSSSSVMTAQRSSRPGYQCNTTDLRYTSIN